MGVEIFLIIFVLDFYLQKLQKLSQFLLFEVIVLNLAVGINPAAIGLVEVMLLLLV